MFSKYVVLISSSFSNNHLPNTKSWQGISSPLKAEISVIVSQKEASSISDITDSESYIRKQNMTEYGTTHDGICKNIKQIF
jgi:hypothetical protein